MSNEAKPWEMDEAEFAAFYREGQVREFQALRERMRSEIGGRVPRKIPQMVFASREDQQLAEMIEELARLDAIVEQPYLRPAQLKAQQVGFLKRAIQAGETVSNETLRRFHKDLK